MNEQLQKDIAEWQERADNWFNGAPEVDAAEPAEDLLNEARALLLRASEALNPPV